jgi:hypothetical protein
MFKWFKKRFKTVYCDECIHRSETEWFGYYSCLVAPMTVEVETGSKFERPKTKILHGHHQCRNVKWFGWCKEYKAKEE